MEETCREILSELRTYLDGECPKDLEAAIVRHIGTCPPCLDRADFERELRSIISARCRESAPPDLLSRVMDRLQA